MQLSTPRLVHTAVRMVTMSCKICFQVSFFMIFFVFLVVISSSLFFVVISSSLFYSGLCNQLLFLIAVAKVRLFSDISKFWDVIRLDFEQLSIRKLVKKSNS